MRDWAFYALGLNTKLRMNAYDIAWSDRPSNNERRWWKLELYECSMSETTSLSQYISGIAYFYQKLSQELSYRKQIARQLHKHS